MIFEDFISKPTPDSVPVEVPLKKKVLKHAPPRWVVFWTNVLSGTAWILLATSFGLFLSGAEERMRGPP